MFKILACISLQHDYLYLSLAVLVCVIGCMLTSRLTSRARHRERFEQLNWILMAGVIGGSTIWTAHFLSVLGYEIELPHGFSAKLTFLTLFISIAFTTLGLYLTAAFSTTRLAEAGGAVIGLGIVAMHYVGMQAFLVAGHFVWDPQFVAASVFFGPGFGILATRRMARPTTRFCRYTSSIFLILCILFVHFSGMTALSIVPDGSVVLSENMVQDRLLMAMIVTAMTIMLGLAFSSYVVDLNASKQVTEQFRYLSQHDALTGLPNRVGYEEFLLKSLAGARASGTKLAVIAMDLNRFKAINDVHGHAAGDAVLCAVAERLASLSQKDEYFARLGGDEFGGVLKNLASKEAALSFAEKINAQIALPIYWRDKTFHVGSSIGISVYPDLADTSEKLKSQADFAMYRSKSNGIRMPCLYDPEMDEEARHRSALAMEMRLALLQGHFEIYYQRQNNGRTDEVVGLEALLRWNHPEKGRISPDEFIPIAEKTGFIYDLGDWVLRAACKEAATWKNPLHIAVNVAPLQITDIHFPGRLADILAITKLDPHRLELEITESGLIADQQRALHIIRQLKAMGVKIVMDDYGTGYSSLSTLQTFPFDKIKIDRTFIRDVMTNRHSAAIVRSTIILAHSLDIPVLIEGVETREHLDFLADCGNFQVQGYLYGPPVPISALQDVVNPGDLPVSGSEPATEKVRRSA